MAAKLITTLLFIIIFASPAMALDMEYITYGNFPIISNAFQMIGLWMSDAGWTGLIYTFTVLGIAVGISTSAVKGLVGNKSAILSATAIQVIPGLMVYLALFSPTSMGNLTVYDPNLNRTQTIALPNGLVAVYGTLNKIETGISEIIDTGRPVGAPSIVQGSSQIGFNVLYNLANVNGWSDWRIEATVDEYLKQCVLFEIARTGSTLDPAELNNTTTDWITTLGKATNPAIFMLNYLTNQAGDAVSCTEGWTALQPALSNAANVTPVLKAAAAKAGLNVDDINEYNSFKQIAADYCTYAHGTPNCTTPEAYTRDILLANQWAEMLRQGGNTAYDGKITSTGVTSSIGSLMSFDRYSPYMRGYLQAAVAGIIALLLMFLPTPLFSKIMGGILGLVAWLVIWDICDAITNRLVLDQLYRTYSDIRANNMGIEAVLQTTNVASDAISMLGTFRASSLMLATIVSTLLIRFAGSHAMSMLAGNVSGDIQQRGAQAGVATQTQQGRAQETQSNLGVYPTATMANAHSTAALAKAEIANRGLQHQAGSQQWEQFKGLKEQGMLDKNTTFQQWQGMQKAGFGYADKGGQHHGAIGPDGKVVQMSTATGFSKAAASGDVKNPTRTFSTSNMGIFKPMISEGFDERLSNAANEAGRSATQAAHSAVSSVSAANAEEKHFSDAISKSNSFTEAERQSHNEVDSWAKNETEQVAQRLSDTTGVSIDKARQYVNTVAGEIRGGVGFDTSDSAWGKALANAAGIKVNAGGSLSKTASAADSESYHTLANRMDTKDYAKIANAVRGKTISDSSMIETASQRGVSDVTSAGEGYRTSLTNSQQAMDKFSKSYSVEQGYNKALEVSRSHGARIEQDLAPQVVSKMIADKGEDWTGRVLRGESVSAGDVAAVRGYIREAQEQHIGNIANKAGTLEAPATTDKAAFASGMDDIKAKATAADPSSLYGVGQTVVTERAEGAGVGAETVIPRVTVVKHQPDMSPLQAPADKNDVAGKVLANQDASKLAAVGRGMIERPPSVNPKDNGR